MFKITPTLIYTIFLFASFSLKAQNQLLKREFNIEKKEELVKIDGQLDEEIWSSIDPISDFVMHQPDFGSKGSFKTEVKMFYTDESVYIGAFMEDMAPDSILRELTKRDALGNTDYFGVIIDAYQDGINGLGFFATPTDIQYDIKYSADADGGGSSPIMEGDRSWDAVWDVRASTTENGWYLEFEIPFSALRFPTKDIQSWNINFYRHFRRSREDLFWNPVNPETFGLVNQCGIVNGIANVKSPVRLSATPFVTAYANNVRDGQESTWGSSFSGGMDIRYGINDAFTLDMTLIPDFGEAISDNQVLNLGPFEVRFDENRQFFKEGIELFNKGNLFYSRRIGGAPLNYYSVDDLVEEGDSILFNPTETQLINATKVSGRNTKGLGIGVFNAVSARSVAEVLGANDEIREVETNPLTNYNVLVLDQNLKNNSSVSLVNTNVMRFGSDYDANVTAGLINLFTKNSTYNLNGQFKLSQKYYTDETELGYNSGIEFSKPTGNFTFDVAYDIESDTYDPNDLGFLYNNNSRVWSGGFRYRNFKPKNPNLNSWRVVFSNSYERLYNPNKFAQYFMRGWANVVTKNFNVFGWWVNGEPVDKIDYFEARTAGQPFVIPASIGFGPYISTDYRKTFAFDLEGGVRFFDDSDIFVTDINFGPRFRLSDRFFVRWNLGYTSFTNDRGYVDKFTNDEGAEEILFGIRERDIFENSVRLRYSFNANMNLNVRVRHYWSVAKYSSFATLDEEGYLNAIDYNNEYDRSFTSFLVDAVFQWRFAPGSDIFVVWKNSVDAFEMDQNRLPYEYSDNFRYLNDFPVFNTVSFKLIYYLDYNQIVK